MDALFACDGGCSEAQGSPWLHELAGAVILVRDPTVPVRGCYILPTSLSGYGVLCLTGLQTIDHLYNTSEDVATRLGFLPEPVKLTYNWVLSTWGATIICLRSAGARLPLDLHWAHLHGS